ncbi:hypothetical protein AK830_g7593 [Neonectria ditissima]|uniref:Uncharacterized protein n=1 Tax=Neonectria ditissima TaxID=78410 RepID=A0A0P7B9V6_9HYPO|nr:hypothetical protein AK830_g7593 [Neonectria ditissima]
MRFSAGLIAITATMANALVPAVQYTAGLNNLTTLTQSLLGPASQISASNLQQFTTGTGPVITLITGATQLVTLSSNLVGNEAVSTGGVSGGADTDKLVAAVQQFSLTQQQLLSTIVGKKALFANAPIVSGVLSAVLTAVKASVDSLLAKAIASLPATAASASTDSLNALDGALDTAIAAFRGALPQ